MKIAIVHEWLAVNGGSEKVLKEILSVYKNDQPDIFTLFNFLDEENTIEILENKKVRTTFIQNIPFSRSLYRLLLPIFPFAVKSISLKNYGLIISSSHAVIKGIKKDNNATHVCYCHTPMRYAWDLYDDYMEQSPFYKKIVQAFLIFFLRKWDYKTAQNVDFFIANSKHVKDRIKKSYNRESVVIYPPVDTQKFLLNNKARKNYYICFGRLVPYKRVDLIIEAFKEMPDKELIIVGSGYAEKQLMKQADKHDNIKFWGFKSTEDLINLVQAAKASIFAAKEDFGITCVESQCCGTPVIALNYGGYKETVAEDISGVFFNEQSKEAIIDAIKKFEKNPLSNYELIRERVLAFSKERFHKELSTYVNTIQKGDAEYNKQSGVF